MQLRNPSKVKSNLMASVCTDGIKSSENSLRKRQKCRHIHKKCRFRYQQSIWHFFQTFYFTTPLLCLSANLHHALHKKLIRKRPINVLGNSDNNSAEYIGISPLYICSDIILALSYMQPPMKNEFQKKATYLQSKMDVPMEKERN